MKRLNWGGWGFTADSWKGERGEYWVLAQAGLMLVFVLLPIYRPGWLTSWLTEQPSLLYGVWLVSGLMFLAAGSLLIRGLLDLGNSLTPLPYPLEQGRLVQTGIYAIVRHPLYSGVTLAAKAYAIGQLSLSHLAATLVLFIFFNLKASREEGWLSQKYPEYADYQQRVKKLIPGIY